MSEEMLQMFFRDCKVAESLYKEWDGYIVSWSPGQTQVKNNMFIDICKLAAEISIEYYADTLHAKCKVSDITFITVFTKKQ